MGTHAGRAIATKTGLCAPRARPDWGSPEQGVDHGVAHGVAPWGRWRGRWRPTLARALIGRRGQVIGTQRPADPWPVRPEAAATIPDGPHDARPRGDRRKAAAAGRHPRPRPGPGACAGTRLAVFGAAPKRTPGTAFFGTDLQTCPLCDALRVRVLAYNPAPGSHQAALTESSEIVWTMPPRPARPCQIAFLEILMNRGSRWGAKRLHLRAEVVTGRGRGCVLVRYAPADRTTRALIEGGRRQDQRVPAGRTPAPAGARKPSLSGRCLRAKAVLSGRAGLAHGPAHGAAEGVHAPAGVLPPSQSGKSLRANGPSRAGCQAGSRGQVAACRRAGRPSAAP